MANKSIYAVGVEYGMDKVYSSKSKVTNAVYSIYAEVKEDPERFTITQDMLNMVEAGMQARRSHKAGSAAEDGPSVAEQDHSNLVITARKKSWKLLVEKLDYLIKNKAAFRKESVVSLAKVAGIVFDKGQLIEGKATDQVAILAKIDENMSTEDAVKELLKLRDAGTKDAD